MNDHEQTPAVRVRNLHKAYGQLKVLRGVSLEVPTGQRVAIIGPSGSGKSTMLRLIMTLERADQGTIQIEGDYLWRQQRGEELVPATIKHTRGVRARVGMVFQHFNLFPHMTAMGNVIEAPMHVLGLTREEARARGRELLASVGLSAKEDAYPAQLSGGQKQRVAIARALAMRPRVMLFDEVTSALDPELVSEVLDVLRQIAVDHDMTMLLVTHQMRFAREIADRIVFFDSGRIVEDGAPNEIFTAPEQERTKEFLRSVIEAT